ncbi:MAG: cbb3-type cytochrome c oxidase subunit I, partial [Burkholderiales bacterium]
DRPAMHSRMAMELHFWLHISGVLLYICAMWIAGVTQGLMWRATGPDGSLTYPFIDSLRAIKGLYAVRFFGGVLILGGMVVMAWNLWHTAAAARARLINPIPVPIPEPEPSQVPAPLPAYG